jgi:transcriptional regulator with XRE-family HTH domain
MADTETKHRQIAARARIARENAGLSQGQAAKKLGIARSSLTAAEAGNRKISAAGLGQLASIYGVGVAWLACAESEADPDRDRIELAARELARLKREDLENVLQLVRSIRSKGRTIS